MLIYVITYYYGNNLKPKENKIDEYSILDSDVNLECECKRKNLVILTSLNKSHYKVDQLSEKTKKILKTYFIEKRQKIMCNKLSWLRRGNNQKIVSYSLYGKNPIYLSQLASLVRAIKKFYPDWLIRIYHDDTILKSIKCEIECLTDETGKIIDNSDFCDINKLPLFLSNEHTWSILIHKAMWRFLPIGDSFVDVFISRDSDSSIIQREIDSVNIWLKSNKTGHIMRGKN